MSDLIAALKLEHAKISGFLDVLESEMLAIAVGKTPDYRSMREIMRYVAIYSDRYHHPKEDLIFRQLVICDPGMSAEVEALINEHAQINLAGLNFNRLLRAPIGHSVTMREQLRSLGSEYVQAQREHIIKEEERWFPLARKLLGNKQWQVIDAGFHSIDSPA